MNVHTSDGDASVRQVTGFAAELAARDRQIADMKNVIDELQAKMESLKPPPSPPPLSRSIPSSESIAHKARASRVSVFDMLQESIEEDEIAERDVPSARKRKQDHDMNEMLSRYYAHQLFKKQKMNLMRAWMQLSNENASLRALAMSDFVGSLDF